MPHPFDALAAEYATLLDRMAITRPIEVRTVAERLVDNAKAGRYGSDEEMLGIPVAWRAASFEREAASNFRLNPAQGDPWDRVSQHVPKGRGPFACWKDAAKDAYRLDRLDQVGAGNWTWERACYEGEAFNGFGPRAHGIHTGYLWAGTNIYSRGKYTRDGHWDPNVRDQQLGLVPLIKAMIEIDPSVGLASALPSIAPLPLESPQPPPEGLGGSTPHSVRWLQESLNKIQHAGLKVDGSFGRHTRREVARFQEAHGLEADGLAGARTLRAVERALG